jgi:hypothetical protein
VFWFRRWTFSTKISRIDFLCSQLSSLPFKKLEEKSTFLTFFCLFLNFWRALYKFEYTQKHIGFYSLCYKIIVANQNHCFVLRQSLLAGTPQLWSHKFGWPPRLFRRLDMAIQDLEIWHDTIHRLSTSKSQIWWQNPACGLRNATETRREHTNCYYYKGIYVGTVCLTHPFVRSGYEYILQWQSWRCINQSAQCVKAVLRCGRDEETCLRLWWTDDALK